MLLPYATVKPHDPADCIACSPARPGHQRCMNSDCPGNGENDGAGCLATMQIPKHATEQEYNALPIGLRPIDGIAIQAIYACDHCAEDAAPFCVHDAPAPQPCPTCGAEPEQPCVKRDGVTPLHFTHSTRPAPVFDTCGHAHRPDCPIFGPCPCGTQDQPPTRPKHPAAGAVDPDISRLLIPVPAAQMLLHQHGVHWWQIREAASVWTQDTQPALQAEYATLDERGHLRFDDHGHEIRELIVIVIETPPQS